MFLKLGDEHRQDLFTFSRLSVESFQECCQVAIAFIADGDTNPRTVAVMAQKIGIERQEADTIIKALTFLFSECTRAKLPEPEFSLTIMDLNLPNQLHNELVKQYRENVDKLRQLYVRAEMKAEHLFGISAVPQYKDLEWRMEIELDRRSARQLMRPQFTLNVITSEQEEWGTKDKEKRQNHVLMSAEYHDLRHVTDVLGEALKEIKTQHVRRIRHYIQ